MTESKLWGTSSQMCDLLHSKAIKLYKRTTTSNYRVICLFGSSYANNWLSQKYLLMVLWWLTLIIYNILVRYTLHSWTVWNRQRHSLTKSTLRHRPVPYQIWGMRNNLVWNEKVYHNWNLVPTSHPYIISNISWKFHKNTYIILCSNV